MSDLDDLDIWQEVTWGDDGLTVTTYAELEDNAPVVEDESYWTWSELREQILEADV